MIKLKRIMSFITAFSMFLLCLPAFSTNVSAASMVTAGVKATDTPLTSMSDTVTVDISLTGIPYAGVEVPNDVVLVIDRSGSMNGNYDAMIDAAEEFIQKVDLNIHRIGIVDYHSVAQTFSLTNNCNQLTSTLEDLRAKGPEGGTNMNAAIDNAISLLTSKRPSSQGAIVLMTDGEPDNEIKAKESAENAKKKGYAFFTVALCRPNNTNADKMLRTMATSESSHYSVFSVDKLNSVYSSIAAKIGNANAKNLVITQEIPPEFEYVAGSADKTIPAPSSVTSDCITWNMNQLAQGVSGLSYQLRLKSEYTPYELSCGSGQVKYKDYDGNTQIIDFKPCTVYNSIISDVIINDIQPPKGETKVVNTVTITGEGMIGVNVTYGNVTIGKNNIKESPDGKTLIVNLPVKNIEDYYPIKIMNDRRKDSVIDYYVEKNEPPKVSPVVIKAEPSTIVMKTAAEIEITGENLQGATITRGRKGYSCEQISDKSVKLKLTSGFATSAGTYTFTLKNSDGMTTTFDINVVASLPKPAPVINDIQPPEILLNTTTDVTITGENLNGCKVYLGKSGLSDKKVSISDDGKTMIVTLPAQKNEAVLKITVNNGGQKSEGTVKVVKKIIPDMVLTDITPDSGVSGTAITVTITGENIGTPRAIYIGRTSVGVGKCTVSGKTISFTIPVGASVSPGSKVTIEIVNTDGKRGTIDFTYQ